MLLLAAAGGPPATAKREIRPRGQEPSKKEHATIMCVVECVYAVVRNVVFF